MQEAVRFQCFIIDDSKRQFVFNDHPGYFLSVDEGYMLRLMTFGDMWRRVQNLFTAGLRVMKHMIGRYFT